MNKNAGAGYAASENMLQRFLIEHFHVGTFVTREALHREQGRQYSQGYPLPWELALHLNRTMARLAARGCVTMELADGVEGWRIEAKCVPEYVVSIYRGLLRRTRRYHGGKQRALSFQSGNS
jgi:hypothetical protein